MSYRMGKSRRHEYHQGELTPSQPLKQYIKQNTVTYECQ